MNNTAIINITTNNIDSNVSIDTTLSFCIQYIVISLIKLGLSVVLSLVISIERELHTHPGGACTHMLVGLGSCLYTMISIHLGDKHHVSTADPARICAQIVSGMGFLGSATIFKSNNYVKGINTAANLWISAAISMAIGADLWELGLTTSLFTIIILFINNRYKRIRYGKNKKNDISEKNDDEDNSIDIHSDIELGSIRSISRQSELSRDACDAPYGDETYNQYD